MLLHVAAGSFDAAATMLKTCLKVRALAMRLTPMFSSLLKICPKMLPDWTEGIVMLGYVLRRGGHASEALAVAQGLLLRCTAPTLLAVCLAANCHLTSCYYEQAFLLLTKMRFSCSESSGPFDAAMMCNYGVCVCARVCARVCVWVCVFACARAGACVLVCSCVLA